MKTVGSSTTILNEFEVIFLKIVASIKTINTGKLHVYISFPLVYYLLNYVEYSGEWMESYCNIPNFQFGMLYIDHSCIPYFIAFCLAILEILSNSRTLGESWGFPRFSNLILSNFEMRIFGFNYFSLRKYFILKIYERR